MLITQRPDGPFPLHRGFTLSSAQPGRRNAV